jgi:DNA-binding response OmpR family regulator
MDYATAGSEPASDHVRVLLIEDDRAVSEMYRFKLEQDGYEVTVASDGETGLELARRSPPDLLFLDIRLPNMDGFAVLEALRADPVTEGLPVVILSNFGERELIDRGYKLGILEYLIKSQATPAEVAGGVRSWIESVPAKPPG